MCTVPDIDCACIHGAVQVKRIHLVDKAGILPTVVHMVVKCALLYSVILGKIYSSNTAVIYLTVDSHCMCPLKV